jgi:hypothetical protein
MFGARLIAFIIAALLLFGAIPPTDGWFLALTVLIGLSMMRSLFFWPWRLFRWGARQAGWSESNWRNRRVRWADEWWS